QRTGWPSRIFHVEESHASSIRRKGRSLHVALQLGQPPRRAAVKEQYIKVGLVGFGAIGDENQRFCIRGPHNLALVAMLFRPGGRRYPFTLDRPALEQIAQRRQVYLRASLCPLSPRQKL